MSCVTGESFGTVTEVEAKLYKYYPHRPAFTQPLLTCRISDQYTSFYINFKSGNGVKMSSHPGEVSPARGRWFGEVEMSARYVNIGNNCLSHVANSKTSHKAINKKVLYSLALSTDQHNTQYSWLSGLDLVTFFLVYEVSSC